MIDQATLPLFSSLLPAPGRPDPGAEALRRRAGVEYLDLLVRDVLNRNDQERLPFDWTINPYRGCELGCTYCYARYTHGFFDLADPEDFERKIFVKRRAAEKLRQRLRKSDLRGQSIALGTATDPYQPAEKHYGITRALLEVLTEAEDLTLALTTKSPLVLRDLDLLVELDRRHAVTVAVTLTTVDGQLARSLERQAPDPAARLRTIERLAEAGLRVVVNCMPVMPGLNDSTARLAPLFERALAAGAADVHASALFLRPATRAVFFGWLEREQPALLSLYRRLYQRGDYLGAAARDELLANYRRLRLEHGLPRALPGRA